MADNERIEEEMSVRQQEERRRQKQQELKKKKVKNEIIVKALSEAPVLEQVTTNCLRYMYHWMIASFRLVYAFSHSSLRPTKYQPTKYHVVGSCKQKNDV